jgi:hypothetical protein
MNAVEEYFVSVLRSLRHALKVVAFVAQMILHMYSRLKEDSWHHQKEEPPPHSKGKELHQTEKEPKVHHWHLKKDVPMIAKMTIRIHRKEEISHRRKEVIK